MPEHTPLISTIVVGLVLAFVLGALANRLRISPLVGYLLAGVLIGPFTPGYVADQRLANDLAEIGIILLMFGVGLHFTLDDLLSVRAIALPGALAQIASATALGAGLGYALGWPLGGGLVFGLALSVASTVVLLRALQERRLVESERGRAGKGHQPHPAHHRPLAFRGGDRAPQKTRRRHRHHGRERDRTGDACRYTPPHGPGQVAGRPRLTTFSPSGTG